MPPTWNIGSGVRLTVSSSKPHTGDVQRRRREVAMRGQDALRHAGCARGVHLQHGVVRCSAPARVDRGDAMASQRLVVVADRDDVEVCGDGARDVAGDRRRTPGPASSSGAPASSRMAASSGGASRQFKGTATAPILAAANSSSTTSGAVRSRCATRVPGPTPAASRACARRLERSSSSAKVSARAPCLIATRPRARAPDGAARPRPGAPLPT